MSLYRGGAVWFGCKLIYYPVPKVVMAVESGTVTYSIRVL